MLEIQKLNIILKKMGIDEIPPDDWGLFEEQADAKMDMIESILPLEKAQELAEPFLVIAGTAVTKAEMLKLLGICYLGGVTYVIDKLLPEIDTMDIDFFTLIESIKEDK